MWITWIISFMVLMAIGVPISFAIGLGAIVAVLAFEGTNALMIPTMLMSSMDSFVLTAVPLFMATGVIMMRSGLADRLFDFSETLVGWTRGGSGHANVVASMIFGGISGSSVADVVALGPLEVHHMTQHGYKKVVAAALTVASSTLSAIVPPSIIMVVYSVAAGVSASEMLVAGLIPGIIVGLSLMGANAVISRYYGIRATTRFSVRKVCRAGMNAGWAIAAPLIILGGLFTGFFTPTEAGLVAAVYSFLVARFVYKTLSFRQVGEILMEVGRGSGVALMILGTASVAAHILAVEQVPQKLADLAMGLSGNMVLIWAAMITLFLVVGMFMEALAAVIILTPVMLPFIQKLGIDPIHFGVVFIVSMCIGLMTPPVGVCLFVMCRVANVKMESLALYVLPHVAVLTVVVIILAWFPALSLFLTDYVK